MNYHEAISCTVSASEARAEIVRHGESWFEFVREFGDCAEYEGADVIEFLGY